MEKGRKKMTMNSKDQLSGIDNLGLFEQTIKQYNLNFYNELIEQYELPMNLNQDISIYVDEIDTLE